MDDRRDTHLTLDSLFDGSGSFPLGGMLAGITPVWASEIEPFPIRVTTKRLPLLIQQAERLLSKKQRAFLSCLGSRWHVYSETEEVLPPAMLVLYYRNLGLCNTLATHQMKKLNERGKDGFLLPFSDFSQMCIPRWRTAASRNNAIAMLGRQEYKRRFNSLSQQFEVAKARRDHPAERP